MYCKCTEFITSGPTLYCRLQICGYNDSSSTILKHNPSCVSVSFVPRHTSYVSFSHAKEKKNKLPHSSDVGLFLPVSLLQLFHYDIHESNFPLS